jgi:hypothetical protein
MSKKCPKNTICVNKTIFILVLFFLMLILFIFLRTSKSKVYISTNVNTVDRPLKDVYHDIYIPPIQKRSSSFTQVGILKRKDDETSKERETIIPLFGRGVHFARGKWQYYTTTDKQTSIKLPIKSKGKDCMLKYGVDELFSDDVVFVEGIKNMFYVIMYDNQMY